MKRLILVFLLGCSSTPEVCPPYPHGTYVIHYDRVSGDCEGLPTAVIQADEYVKFTSSDYCWMSVECQYPFGNTTLQLSGWMHSVGSGELSGRQNVRVVNWNGSLYCSGTYDTTWIKE